MTQLQLFPEPTEVVRHWWLYNGQPLHLGSTVTDEAKLYSFAWFCAVCGRVWARSPAWKGKERQQYEVVEMTCEQCIDDPIALDIPGSLIIRNDADYNAAMPEALLRREVLCLADWLDRGGALRDIA